MTDYVHGQHTVVTGRDPSFQYATAQVTGEHLTRRTTFFGLGRVNGTVFIKDTPSARLVRLIERRSGLLRMATFSAEDGAYVFDFVPADREYIVLGLDYSGQYNAVVEDHVIAVIPPERL